MTAYIIKKKASNPDRFDDLASSTDDRYIVFAPDCKFAVVLSSYSFGKGYTTHKTEKATVAASHRRRDDWHRIIDEKGNEYEVSGGRLRKI